MFFPFRCKNQLNCLEVTVDDRRCFDEHVSNICCICKNLTNQFKVISRFRKLIPATVLLRFYKAYKTTLPALFYRMAFLSLSK